MARPEREYNTILWTLNSRDLAWVVGEHTLDLCLQVVAMIMYSRVATKQYLNGLFGSFGNFEPSKQTHFLSSIKQTKVAVCSVVW